MSLVNQVLQDLQHRRGEHPDMEGLAVARPARPPSSPRRYGWFIAGAVALGLALFALQQLFERPAAPVEVTPVAVKTTPAAAAPVTQPEVTPVVAAEPVPEPVIETPPVVAATPQPEPAVVSPAADPVPTVTLPPRGEPSMSRTLVATTPRQRADAAYADALRELSAGRRDLAEVRMRDALGHDPSLVDARLALANLLATRGATREAEALLLQGLRLAPDAAPLAQRYARLLFERDDLGGAIGVLLQAPPPVAVDTEYHAFLAALLQRAGNHNAAADTYASLVEVQPDAGLWWMGLGISLEAEQRYAPALDAYRNAARDPRLSARVADFVRERIAVLSE